MKKILLFSAFLSFTACGDLFKEKGSSISQDNFCNGTTTFCVTSIEAEEFGLNNSTDELGLSNKKQFNFKACVTDPLGRAINTLRPFNISDGETTKTARANGDGCFQWIEQIDVDSISPQKVYVIKRTFSATEGNTGSNDVYFNFDPWGSKVYYDPYFTWNIPKEYKAEQNIKFSGKVAASSFDTANFSVVKLDSIELDTFRHDYYNYEIDEDLNLTVAHKYRVNFSPSILKKSIGKLYDELEAKKGQVKAVFIFMRDDANNPDMTDMANYVAHLEHTFTINPNVQTIKEDVVFKFPDISALETRMRVLVSVEPVVQSTAIKRANFEGNIAKMSEGVLNLMNTKLNVDQIFRTFKQVLSDADKNKVKPLDRYLQTMQTFKTFAYLNSKSFVCNPADYIAESSYNCSRDPDPIPKILDKAFEDDNKLSLDLNSVDIYFREAMAKAVGVPRGYIGTLKPAKKIAFVEKILQKNFIPGDVTIVPPASITTSQNFSISSNETTQTSQSRGWSTSLGFNPLSLLNFVPVVGPLATTVIGGLASVGGAPSLSMSIGSGGGWSFASATSQSSGTGANQSYTVNFVQIPAVVRAQVHQCFLVEAEPTPLGKKYTEKGQNYYALYCSDKLRAKEFVETYYSIHDSLSQSYGQDNSIAERKWVMFIRGSPYFGMFRNLIENKVVEVKKGIPFSVRIDESLFGDSEDYEALNYARQKSWYKDAVAKVASLQLARTSQVAPGMVLPSDNQNSTAAWKKPDNVVYQTVIKNMEFRKKNLETMDTIVYQ